MTVGVPAWHTVPGLDATKALHVERTSGLSAEEAALRLVEIGPNRLPQAARRRWAFLRRLGAPAQVVLLAAGVASVALGDVSVGLVVVALAAVNAVLALHQAGRAGDPAAAVAAMVAAPARVRRDGRLQGVAAEEIVPGDMVAVAVSDVVPADGRLVDGAALAVDESALTGDRVPVAKSVAVVDDPGAPLGERTDMVYMGTRVTDGCGELVVTATGAATELGHVAELLAAPRAAAAPLVRLPRTPLALAAAALAASVAANLARDADLDAVLTAAVALVVATVPAALPASVSALLARGARALDPLHAVVRRPAAIATLGEVSAIVAAKSGTLTADRPVAVELALPGRRYTIAGGRIRRVAGEPPVPLEPFLLPLSLATDPALVAVAEAGGVDIGATCAAYPRVAALPFDAAYGLSASLHRIGDETLACFVTGSPEQLVARARGTAASRRRYLEEQARLTRQGLRVVATGRCDLRAGAVPGELLAHLEDLELLALIGLADPPRPDVCAALADAAAAGIQVSVVTADDRTRAGAIASQLGLDAGAVIARATAKDKVAVVDALRASGRVVAASGSVAGDAPAVAAADVGIAVGAAGAVVSEAAAIVLRGGDLATIVRAAGVGRDVARRLAERVRVQVGVTAAMALTFLGASVFDVAGGVPFRPPEALAVAFATLLGPTVYRGVAAPPVQAIVTLVVMALAENEYGTAIARTLGAVTFVVLALSPDSGDARHRTRK